MHYLQELDSTFGKFEFVLKVVLEGNIVENNLNIVASIGKETVAICQAVEI